MRIKRKDYSIIRPEQWAILVKEVGNQFQELSKIKSKQSKNLAWPVYIIIGIIFLGTIILGMMNVIDGQSITFLAGTIVGYLLTYLGGYVTPED